MFGYRCVLPSVLSSFSFAIVLRERERESRGSVCSMRLPRGVMGGLRLKLACLATECCLNIKIKVLHVAT